MFALEGQEKEFPRTSLKRYITECNIICLKYPCIITLDHELIDKLDKLVCGK